jgi:hypothetical protein
MATALAGPTPIFYFRGLTRLTSVDARDSHKRPAVPCVYRISRTVAMALVMAARS